jgi:2-polyprenyl-3-methyl-5-hydroxy-6-metoxy-1,4-benzoquinol methylase
MAFSHRERNPVVEIHEHLSKETFSLRMISTNHPTVYKPTEWETVACPFCGSDKFSIYERYGSELQFTYVLCKNCKLVYQSPRPRYDQDFIDAAYASYYQFTDSLDLNSNPDVPESSVNMFRKELDHLLKYDKMRTAVLDIGSGMGTFLVAAKPHYREAVGLDVSAQMAAFVQRQLGLKIFLEQFEDFKYDKKFSLIHMSHVIEHIPNPKAWLQKARKMLEPGGILVINVPNKFSISFRMQHLFYKMKLKKQFSDAWADPSRTPDHLFEPTVPSMLQFLKDNNYKVLDYFSYSRKDPVSKGSVLSKLTNRMLHIGSNLSFITTPK